jgi:hypothetical protein
MVPNENNAILCVGKSVSIKTDRSSVTGTPTRAISAARMPPLRTRLPIAPAALARVFSSASPSAAAVSSGIEQCSARYSASQ